MGFLKTSEPLSIHLKHTGFQVARECRVLAGKRLIIPRKVSLGPKHLGVSEVEDTHCSALAYKGQVPLTIHMSERT